MKDIIKDKIVYLKINIFSFVLVSLIYSISYAKDNPSLSVGGMLDLNISPYQFVEKKYNFGFKPVVFYDDDTFYSEGDEVGVYLYQDDQNEFRINAYYDGLEFVPTDEYQNLNKRKWSILAGASYMRITSYGGFKLQIAKDILSRHNGMVLTTSYLAEIKSNLWTFYPEFGLKRNDQKYNEYYYGVYGGGENNVKNYNPESSVNPYMSLNGIYFVNNKWNIIFGFEFNYLTNQLFESPIVNKRLEYDFSLGALYSF